MSQSPARPSVAAPAQHTVAAGILLRQSREQAIAGRGEFLLARRPPGKVYAGWWEFPGGKLEAGEDFATALRRELAEELAISVSAADPWLACQHRYPHAEVRLRFFRVRQWQGALTCREHDAMAWQTIEAIGAPPDAEASEASPILPANAPILHALRLPAVCLVSNALENGVAGELQRLAAALAGGCRLLQVRDKHLPPAERAAFAEAVIALARRHAASVLVNESAAGELATALGAAGVHLSAAELAGCAQRPDLPLVGASCHSAAELRRAAELRLDYAFLGPVLPTPSHPEAAGLGWPALAELLAAAALPVFALGGMRLHHLTTAWQHGAHGVAMLRGGF